MANPTTNLTMTVPVIGATPDPTWEQNLVQALNIIDAHDHSGAGKGAKVLFNSLDVTTAVPNLNGASLLNVGNLQLKGSTLVSPQAGVGSLQVDVSGSLWYVSPSTQIQLSTASAMITGAASKGFIGDYGSAEGSAYYNAVTTTGGAIQHTFYFYRPLSPTLDSSAHANIAAASAYLTGALPEVDFTDTSLPAVGTWRLGMQVFSGTTAAFTLGVNDGSNVRQPWTVVETTNSLLNNGTYRAYGLHLNEGAFTAQTGSFLNQNTFTVAAFSSNSNSPFTGYYLALNTAVGANAPQQPNIGFGNVFSWIAQYGVGFNNNYNQAVHQSYWADVSPATTAKGGFKIIPYYNNTAANPMIDGYANGTGIIVALGGAAPTGLTINTSSIYFQTTAQGNSFQPIVAGGSTVGANTARFGNGWFDTANVNSLTVNSTLTVPTLSAASFVPTAAWTAGAGYGVYTNFRTVAQGVVSVNGTSVSITAGVNLASGTATTGTYNTRNSFTATIVPTTALPANCLVTATIGGGTTAGNDFIGVVAAAVTGGNIVVTVANAIGTVLPVTSLNILVTQFG